MLTLLVLVLAGPYLRLDYEIDKRPVVALVFDESRSMQLPAGPFEDGEDVAGLARAVSALGTGRSRPAGSNTAGQRAAVERMSRARLAQAVVSAGRARVSGPARRAVRRPRLCLRTRDGPRGGGPEVRSGWSFPSCPTHDAAATHLGDAIGRVLDDAAGRPVAGIFVFSDGQNTGGRSPADAVQVAARAGVPGLRRARRVEGPAQGCRHRRRVHVGARGRERYGAGLGDGRVAGARRQARQGRAPRRRQGARFKNLTLHDAEQQKVELSFQAKEPGDEVPLGRDRSPGRGTRAPARQ